MMNGLALRQIEAGYSDKLILKGTSLEIGPKETFVIMGPSGCGKSTLFLAILGILKPKKGDISLKGRDITRSPIEGRNIGYLPQDYGLFPHLGVLDNVVYGLRVRGIARKDRENVGREMLTRVELEKHENSRVQNLSGGERQRVGLARALAIKPDLLLLDEPLSNVDAATKFDVASQMKKLFRELEIPIVLVTHNHEDALFLAASMAIMIDGKIEQQGSAEEVLKNPKTPFIKRLLTPYASDTEQRS